MFGGGLFDSLTGGGGLSAAVTATSGANPFTRVESPKNITLGRGMTVAQTAIWAGAAVLVAVMLLRRK